MDEQTLKKLQSTEFSILCDLDDYCKRNGIQYFLHSGTALGAIRHKGFIPWDDDIDIGMTRDQYAKFYDTWKKSPMKGYYFENYLDDPNCQTCHGKIRLDGTVFVEEGEEEHDGHQGIWVDIFPFDKISNDPKKRKKAIRKGKELILLTRGNVKKKSDRVLKKLTRSIVRIIPYSVRHAKMKSITDFLTNNCHDLSSGFTWKNMATFNLINGSFPMDSFDTYVLTEFNGKNFSINANYQIVLGEIFGDYMELPPEEDRICKHKPVRIEFSVDDRSRLLNE